MSLKLITIAEKNPLQKPTPKIAFVAGNAHSAITDMVQMGRGRVTNFLNVFPNSLLTNIVESNITAPIEFKEKIRLFCMTMGFSVTSAVHTELDLKQYVEDDSLEEYLVNRLVKN